MTVHPFVIYDVPALTFQNLRSCCFIETGNLHEGTFLMCVDVGVVMKREAIDKNEKGNEESK